jgi:hypothetical protein
MAESPPTCLTVAFPATVTIRVPAACSQAAVDALTCRVEVSDCVRGVVEITAVFDEASSTEELVVNQVYAATSAHPLWDASRFYVVRRETSL